MKRCPKCGQTYTDGDINFCLNDGELLSHLTDVPGKMSDDPPPTIMMDQTRVTDQTRWQAPPPPAPYQSPSPYVPGMSAPPSMVRNNLDQTLAIVSFGLGLGSLVLICCYGGIWLGIPAAVVGFIAIQKINGDPVNYGGKGFAIAGTVIGGISFILAVVFIFLGILSNVLN